MKKLTRGKRRY